MARPLGECSASQLAGIGALLVPSCRTGFHVSVSASHAYTTAAKGLPADRAPGPLHVLRDADPDYVLPDGTLAECERAGDSRPTTSRSTGRHG